MSRGIWSSRPVTRRRFLTGAVTSAAGLGLAACTSQPAASPTALPAAAAAATAPPAAAATAVATAAPQAKYGGTIKTIAASGAGHLDPHISNGPGTAITAAICFSQLLAFKTGPDTKPPSYIPAGDLAASWTQPDDLTYIFKLQPGVKFHNIAPVNGRDLVADDIVFSFQRVIDQKTFAAVLRGVTKMEAPDKSTVKITLDKPNADLLANLCSINLKIIAKEALQGRDYLKAGPLVGTGPWIFESFTLNERFSAKRNPDYFLKGRPYADAYQATQTADAANILSGYRTGAANVVGTGLQAQAGTDLLKSVPNAPVIWIALDRSPAQMMINTKVEPLGDPRVRQAIAKAMDRKAIIENIQLGRAVYGAGIALPGLDWNLPQDELARLMARDVDGAKKLLKDAGKDGGFDVEIIAPPFQSGTLITMAELIQANLKDAGIRATVKPVDGTAFAQLTGVGNFQISVSTFSFPAANGNLYDRVYTGGPQNSVGYANAALDKLIDQQAVLSRDPDGRKKILLDIQRTIISDAIYVNLHNFQQPTFYSTDMRDFYPPAGIFAAGEVWTNLWFDK